MNLYDSITEEMSSAVPVRGGHMVVEGVGSFLKRVFRSRTKNAPMGNERDGGEEGEAQTTPGGRDERRQADGAGDEGGRRIPQGARDGGRDGGSDSVQTAARPEQGRERRREADVDRFYQSGIEPIVRAAGDDSFLRRAAERLYRLVQGGFSLLRFGGRDDRSVKGACAVMKNALGMGDVCVRGISPFVKDGDVGVVNGVLSYFSSAPMTWVVASKQLSQAALNQLSKKMESFSDGGRVIFYRRYGIDQSLGRDVMQAMVGLTR